MKVAYLRGLEILDSRGRPTVYAECVLDDGTVGAASVPSGASTGAFEAVELRDGDVSRHAGLGCRRAVANLGGELSAAVAGTELDQIEFDRRLLEADGTPNKARLGANAILGASIAFARAAAHRRDQPLYRYFSEMVGETPKLPVPIINLYSGGAHAGHHVSVQDVMVVPDGSDMAERLESAASIFRAAADLLHEAHGVPLLTADEGGLAPPVPSSAALLDCAVEAIVRSGATPGADVHLALDVAAAQFFDGSTYRLDGNSLTSADIVDQICRWVDEYPLVSVEDGLADEDWSGWRELSGRLEAALVVGDDLLATNPERIRKAIEHRACDTLLLKPNQVGTLTEAAESWRLARQAGWNVVASARSGETEDSWLADLAVGWRTDLIKIGSVTQSERLAKYNRLLMIERELG